MFKSCEADFSPWVQIRADWIDEHWTPFCGVHNALNKILACMIMAPETVFQTIHPNKPASSPRKNKFSQIKAVKMIKIRGGTRILPTLASIQHDTVQYLVSKRPELVFLLLSRQRSRNFFTVDSSSHWIKRSFWTSRWNSNDWATDLIIFIYSYLNEYTYIYLYVQYIQELNKMDVV